MPARSWTPATRCAGCLICGKSDWCSSSADGAWAVCRRVCSDGAISRTDKNGAEFWLYRLDSAVSVPRPPKLPPPPKQAVCANLEMRDRVYCALLGNLGLSAAHQQGLRRRGLSDREILRRQYRSLPLQGRAAIAKKIVAEFGAETCSTVPGFYLAERDGRRWWSLAGTPGLILPVRGLDSRILALKIRVDDPGLGGKYLTLSSAKHGGPSPGSNVHIPQHDGLCRDAVRLTEGEIKADVATSLSQMLTLSVPGVSQWRLVMSVLRQLGVQKVILAWDSDWRHNPHVARSLAEAAVALNDAGYHVVMETWCPDVGKGIDDVLAAGVRPQQRHWTAALAAKMRGTSVDAKELTKWRA